MQTILRIYNITALCVCVALSFCAFPMYGQVHSRSTAVVQTDGLSGDDTLAVVDGKVITVRDFRERSEFTVRPEVFKNTSVTLNNLILEKILARESEAARGASLADGLQSMLKGMKEQRMREQLFYEVAWDTVTVDTSEIKRDYRCAGREYELEYYRIPAQTYARRIQALFKTRRASRRAAFLTASEILGPGRVHTAKYADDDDAAIHRALYAAPVDTGTVLGPLKLATGDYALLRVRNWKDRPAISEQEQQERWLGVVQSLRRMKSESGWISYQAGIMKGKRLEFDRETFNIVSRWAMEKYLSGKVEDSTAFRVSALGLKHPEIPLRAPFFTFDGTTWTLEDFKEELSVHPLVFRSPALDTTNFREQFKMAVIDMMRDRSLTQEAYRKSLDRHPYVQHAAEVWRDAFETMEEKKQIVDRAVSAGTVSRENQTQLRPFWDSTLAVLQKKYAARISINHTAVARLTQTRIDMIAVRPGNPYPLEVPAFPMILPSGDLSYTRTAGAADSLDTIHDH